MKWYTPIKTAVVGLTPFDGTWDLTDKSRINPLQTGGGGESYNGILSPSDNTQTHHPSDYFSEGDHTPTIEKRLVDKKLDKLNKKKIKKDKAKRIRKKIKEIEASIPAGPIPQELLRLYGILSELEANSSSWYKEAMLPPQDIPPIAPDPVRKGDYVEYYGGEQLGGRDDLQPVAFYMDNFDLEKVADKFLNNLVYAKDAMMVPSASQDEIVSILIDTFIDNPQRNLSRLSNAYHRYKAFFNEHSISEQNFDIESGYEYNPEKDTMEEAAGSMVGYDIPHASWYKEKKPTVASWYKKAQFGETGPKLPTFEPEDWVVKTYKEIRGLEGGEKESTDSKAATIDVMGQSVGKGVFINDNIVLTSYDLVGDNKAVTISKDGEETSASLLSSNPQLGVAVLAVNDPNFHSDAVANIGDSKSMRIEGSPPAIPGQPAIAKNDSIVGISTNQGLIPSDQISHWLRENGVDFNAEY